MRDAEALCGLSRGEIRDSKKPLVLDGAGFPAQAPALCAHPRQASSNAFLNTRTLELAQTRENVQLKAAGRRHQVDAFVQ